MVIMPVVFTISRDDNTDIDIVHVEDTTADYPWYCIEPNGAVHGFDTEMHACIFQRGWRAAKGLDMMTGEPL